MIENIASHSYEFSFFQAVSLLEKHYQSLPDLNFKGIGENKYISQEHIRFSVSASLAFPRSDVSFIEHQEREGDTYTRVEVNFSGLHGSSSPLPSTYTEKLAGREEEDNPVKQFFDFFHNRHLSLIYRVWKKYRYQVQYQSGAKDAFSSRMLHLLGLSSVMQEAEVAELDRAKLLSYVNQLSTRTRSPKLLSGIVAHYFGLSHVYVEEWVYRKIQIHPSQRNELNRRNCTLGQDCHLGQNIPDLMGKFNLCIDDVDFATYQSFLPNGGQYKTLVGLIRFILRDPMEWDLKVKVMLSDIPQNRLGSPQGSCLGQTFWLGTPKEDDTRIRLVGSV